MSKVLLIEDDVSIANLYKTELEIRGHTLQVLNEGSNVVETAAEFQPDLIILDIQLPSKDGLSILQELKADSRTSSFKVIMLTNYATDENIDKALALGAEDFIPKHRIVPEELGEKVDSLLKQ